MGSDEVLGGLEGVWWGLEGPSSLLGSRKALSFIEEIWEFLIYFM